MGIICTHDIAGDNGLLSVIICNAAKDRPEKKRQKAAVSKSSSEKPRSKPSTGLGMTEATLTTVKTPQHGQTKSERDDLSKEKPTKETLRRGEFLTHLSDF